MQIISPARDSARLHALNSPSGVAVGDCHDPAGGAVAAAGGLDLIFGHLTTQSRYVPVFRHVEAQLNNWLRPSGDWSPSAVHDYVVKIQPFKAGGYEVVCKQVCLPDLAEMLDAPRATGKREQPEEQDPESVQRSIKRSKTKVRHRIKSIGADRLFTLTKRENDPERFWTLEDWVKAWADFTRHAKRAGIELEYVAIPERHKKGNFHLHVALRGHININIARRIWWAVCGGRGMGNVDVKFRQDLKPHARLAGLSKYLSKYLTKQFGNDAFNKKRYWSSRHSLPEPIRIILRAQDAKEAVAELADYLALDLLALMGSKHGAYLFPNRDNPVGFWLNYTDDIASDVPF